MRTLFLKSAAGHLALSCCLLLLTLLLPVSTMAADRETQQALPDTGGLIRPVLSERDAGIYRQIFALQEEGRWKSADKLIRTLENRLLMGHVLAQRYLHPTRYRASYRELHMWLKRYADHPEARRIYRLARKRHLKGWKAPTPPVPAGNLVLTRADNGPPAYRPRRYRDRITRGKVRYYKRIIAKRLRRGQLSKTTALLGYREMQKLFDPVEYDIQRAKIAGAWLRAGRFQKAYDLAARAAKRSGSYTINADWWAGLAAWRLERYETAALHFSRVARSRASGRWEAAGGAFWAARALMRARRFAEAEDMLRLAAAQTGTFYGILAARLVEGRSRMSWRLPQGNPAEMRRLLARPEARRAIALAQAGQPQRADRELRLLGGRMRGSMKSLFAIAAALNTPSLTLRIGETLAQREESGYELAAYPVPGWRPQHGYLLDRALLFAFVRQESRFNTRAKSGSGARGLMQVMPATARFAASGSRLGRPTKQRLYQPEYNLALGQRYLKILLEDPLIRGNVLKLAIAYNAGPGNLKKWIRQARTDDPLLLIEVMPSQETRAFVERILANLWMYRQRLGQAAPTLDDLATGRWPRYISLDGDIDLAPPFSATQKQQARK